MATTVPSDCASLIKELGQLDGASTTFRDPAAARRVRDEIDRMVGRGR